MRRGFTLTELVVVISLIVIMSGLSAPAIQSYLASREQTQAIGVFSGAITNAQALARANFTTTAIRVERAFQTDDAGRMLKDVSGRPRWLDHQRVQILAVGLRQLQRPVAGEELVFRRLLDVPAVELPASAWLAPDNALALLASAGTTYQPAATGATVIDTLDTFYLVFNRQGTLARLPASRLVYLDESQNNALIEHPQPSCTGAIAYNHSRFEKSGRDPRWLKTGLALYVDQRTGSVIGAESAR